MQVNGADGYSRKVGRYLKRLIRLPHTGTELAERTRAIETALAASSAMFVSSHTMSDPPSPPARQNSLHVFPALTQQQVAGARLFADREAALDIFPPGGRIAEIGVALGGYTEPMLAKLRPSHFDAFDLFRLHEVEEFWGKSSLEWFSGHTHKQYYQRRFSAAIEAGVLHIHEGDSSPLLASMPDTSYDMIYIDGDHSYEGVLRDAQVAARKLAPGGFLVFNDYVMTDHVTGAPYGVVPVVNELCANQGFAVAYFALQRDLFCDIALHRKR